jgi:hypothetical protein
MKMLIDIKDNKADFFLELMKNLEFIKGVEKIKDKQNNQFVRDITEAFEEVRLYESGKKKLKNAKDLINELRSEGY